MTDLSQQIEEMRVHMNEFATSEQTLVKGLGDALSRADQMLLQDVRRVAADHEARRGTILKELQGLSARMGLLPRPRGPFAAAVTETPLDSPAREAPQSALGGGDWRQAAASIGDAVALRLRSRASAT